jgi:hypothetical protein
MVGIVQDHIALAYNSAEICLVGRSETFVNHSRRKTFLDSIINLKGETFLMGVERTSVTNCKA